MLFVLLVLVIVAIEAQQFPIAAILGVVVMVHVLMVNRQLTQVLMIKLPTAAAADPGVELEGLVTVSRGALIAGLASLRHHPIELAEVDVLARAGVSGIGGIGHVTLRQEKPWPGSLEQWAFLAYDLR